MTELSDGSRRQRRAAARRQQIIDGAVQVFAKKGFHRATTRDIAAAADVAEGTIYNYFASKDDLLIAIMEQMSDLGGREAVLEQALAVPLPDFFRVFFQQRIRDLGDQYDMLLAILPEILSDPVLRQRYMSDFLVPASEMLERHLKQRHDLGQISAADYALVVRALTALIYGLQVLLIMRDPVITSLWQDPERLVDLLVGMFFSGVIAAVPGADFP